MIQPFVVAAALAASVNQPVPPLDLHDRAESSAAVSASVRLEPLADSGPVPSALVPPGPPAKDVESAEPPTVRTPFELVYDAPSGALRLLDASGVALREARLSGLAAVEGPNLLRFEVANLDPGASVRLEELVLRTGELERSLPPFGRGAMTHDLATLWEPALSEGFVLRGALLVNDPPAQRSRRVHVEFGVGRGRRVQVAVDGDGEVRSHPARLYRDGGQRTAVAFFGADEPVALEALEGGEFIGWRDGDAELAARRIELGAGDGSEARTAVFAVAAGSKRRLGSDVSSGAGEFFFSNQDTITIPAGAPTTTVGPAAPYPSIIETGNPIGGAIVDVDVSLLRLDHSFADDLDVVLVSPRGTAVMVLSDACGTTAFVNRSIQFDDEAGGTLPDDNLPGCAINVVQPSAFPPDDALTAPAPTAFAFSLSAFDDENPNGAWRLFVFDDGVDDVGEVEEGWFLEVRTEPYLALVPGDLESPVADPYPLQRTLVPSGTVFGTVLDVDTTLVDVTHSFPDDLDVLLVGPTGARSILMSDACGNADLENYIWEFDDEAAATLSDDDLSRCNTDHVKPTNYESGDVWPAPAPGPPYEASLTVFDGTNPFGVWRLFLVDDLFLDHGFLETDWTLQLRLTGIFRDGFESQNPCQWSQSVGGPPCP